ncbi:MAG: hypothetical protein ABW328_00280 [Ilumatobacteraceae bacterium]
MIEIHADELQPGDVVRYGDDLHRVSHVDRLAGWSWPIAGDDTGWAIALDHEHLLSVLRTAA